MIRNIKNILAAALMVVTVSGVYASEPEAATPNYNLAEQFRQGCAVLCLRHR